jgi:phosphatidylglycerophosphatase A
MNKHTVTFLATWGYSGKSTFMPGTCGSLAALPFAWLIQTAFGGYGLLLASVLICAFGIWISDKYLISSGATSKDPKEVVIDEVAGQWLMLSVVPLTIPAYVIGFVLFRLFDITKPYPISWIDRKLEGGMGIMLDDMLAAVFGIIVYILIEGIIAG